MKSDIFQQDAGSEGVWFRRGTDDLSLEAGREVPGVVWSVLSGKERKLADMREGRMWQDVLSLQRDECGIKAVITLVVAVTTERQAAGGCLVAESGIHIIGKA